MYTGVSSFLVDISVCVRPDCSRLKRCLSFAVCVPALFDGGVNRSEMLRPLFGCYLSEAPLPERLQQTYQVFVIPFLLGDVLSHPPALFLGPLACQRGLTVP